ncbi:MAG: endonuclease MutS2 [Prevotellaceae bacterium]|nr:endonuclease MutS2 [Prevotellaceae bacterium]
MKTENIPTKSSVYPATFEAKLGFDSIRAMVQSRCATSRACELLAEASFCTSFEAMQEQLEQTDEMQRICALDASFPQSGYVDVLHFIGKADIDGAYLDEPELVALAQMADTAGSLAAFFAKQSVGACYPRLSALVQPVQTLEPVSKGVAAIIDAFGKIKDNASPTLQQLRRQAAEVQLLVSRRMQAILKQAQADGYVEESAEVSLRDGRTVIPVTASCKRKVTGLVLDESATGKTSFVEPAEVVELNNRLRELGFAEKREVVRILTAFAAFLRPYLPQVALAAELVARVDFIRAKALFASSIGATKPALTNSPSVGWRSARHPLLEAALKREGKSVVPLDLRLTSDKRWLLISGPNAGGKSACLKTTGLLQYMLQCGFLVPASEDSEAGIFDAIFIDIGDEQSLESDLSTYSAHLQSMKHFLRHANAKTLALLDELGAGTEPQLGGAIAEATLAALVRSGAFGIATTHYANLKHFAGSAAGVQNGAMLFDLQRMSPLFRLEVGAPGSSFAFELAKKAGLPDDVIANARDLLDGKHASFDKSLRVIARDRRYWEEKRAHVKQTGKRLEELVGRLERELALLQSERKRIISEAKDEAKALLANANKQIENTIRSIKEAQAEKEKTREARSQLASFAQRMAAPDESDTDALLRRKAEELQTLQQQWRKKEKPEHDDDDDHDDDEEEESIPHKEQRILVQASGKIAVGSTVRIAGQTTMGKVAKLNGNGTALLAMGNLYITAPIAKLEVLKIEF